MSKRYDVVAKVGEYQDRNGETKPRWKNVGAVITTDKGHALLLDKTFNPAGLAEPGRESILLSLFEPKEQGQGGQRTTQPQQSQANDNLEDDIPFNREAA